MNHPFLLVLFCLGGGTIEAVESESSLQMSMKLLFSTRCSYKAIKPLRRAALGRSTQAVHRMHSRCGEAHGVTIIMYVPVWTRDLCGIQSQQPVQPLHYSTPIRCWRPTRARYIPSAMAHYTYFIPRDEPAATRTRENFSIVSA